MEVVQIVPQEFVQNRTVEQIVVPVGHGVEVYLLPKELDEKVAKLRAEDSGGAKSCSAAQSFSRYSTKNPPHPRQLTALGSAHPNHP